MNLRSAWRFAVFGVVGFALASIALEVGRACGLIDFWLERLPGELLTTPFPLSSESADWVSYFGFGALLGLAYRPVFIYLGRFGGRASWRSGVVIGLLQWLLFGVAIGLLDPLLTYDFPMLPPSPPLRSVDGLILAAFIFLLNISFGAFMGSLANLPLQESSVKEEPALFERPSEQKAA